MDCIARETVDRGYVAIKDSNVATGRRPSCVAMATRTLQQETKLGDAHLWKVRYDYDDVYK